MKALFVSNDPTIFDPKSATRARMRAYAAAIGELHIVSRGPRTINEQDGTLFLHSVKPFPTILGRVLLLRTLARRARKLIKQHAIEVVSAQDPFEHGAAAQSAVHGTSAKLHVQVHTDFCSPFFASESRKNAWRVRVADAVLLDAAGIRVVSERVKHSLIERYGDRISEPSVIPIAFIADAPTPAVALPKQPFTFMLMAISRLEKEKQLDDAIRVVAHLVREQRYPVGLVIAGEGSERGNLTKLAQRLGIETNVVFLGERADVPALLPTAQAFIQTSAYEGYGRTYIEAALAGVPMVVTDAGIIGEVFESEKAALVCPVGDVVCMVRQVSRLVEDLELRRELKKYARDVATEYLATFADLPSRIASDLAQTTART